MLCLYCVIGAPVHSSASHVDYVPSLFSFVGSPVKRRLAESVQRHSRSLARSRTTASAVSPSPIFRSPSQPCLEDVVDEEVVYTDVLPLSSTATASDFVVDSAAPLKVTVSVQTELSGAEIDRQDQELAFLRSKVISYQSELQECTFGVRSLQCDDDAAKFYTGLSYIMLMTLFKYLSAFVKKSATRLSRIDELFLVLVKLRLNLTNEDLGYRFKLHRCTITKIFHKWLNIMYTKLAPLIAWPDRQSVRLTLPSIFHANYPKLVCIIDCTEIFIERPFGLKARAITYSNYKKHNTVKYLIGITPTGSISFLSQGWGGRVTDDHLTRSSGFLNKLIPGDVVMADRGFRLEEDFALQQSQLIVPAFTRGKKQLTAEEVERSRSMSNVRIHVERVIGVLKNRYTILQGTLPVTLVKRATDANCPTVDKIMTVCCALCNLGDTVVPE